MFGMHGEAFRPAEQIVWKRSASVTQPAKPHGLWKGSIQMTSAVTSLATMPPSPQAEQGEAQGSQVYRIGKAFAAVQFDLEAKGRIVFLPEGAELHLVGTSCLRKCFEVTHKNRLYNIFEADLLGPWSIRVKNRRTHPVPALAAEACA
jgi:hypothetical protein